MNDSSRDKQERSERVQQFFAAFQDEAKALVHHKLLNMDEAGAIASAFARIAADLEAARPSVGQSFNDGVANMAAQGQAASEASQRVGSSQGTLSAAPSSKGQITELAEGILEGDENPTAAKIVAKAFLSAIEPLSDEDKEALRLVKILMSGKVGECFLTRSVTDGKLCMAAFSSVDGRAVCSCGAKIGQHHATGCGYAGVFNG